MRNRLWQSIMALLCLSGCAPWFRPAPPPGAVKWAVYYNTKVPAAAFNGYDLVVFDRLHHPDLRHLDGPEAFAYISIGEVEDSAPERKSLEKAGLLLGRNDRWKSHVVDVTAPLWRNAVLEKVADARKRGFDGVMLDTVDSPLAYAAKESPERLAAMQEACLMLIEAIRQRYPDMKLMLNRGFALLPDAAQQLDFLLIESIYTQPDETSGQFVLAPAISYAQAVTQLHRAVAFAPRLQILTLDYWNQNDVHGVQSIYAQQRANGFSPYVTTPDLQHFTPEPAPAGRPPAVD